MVFARRLFATATLLALAALAPAFSGCAMFAGSPDYTPMPNLQQAGLKTLWEAQVGLAGGEHVNRGWRIGDAIYLTTSRHRLLCFAAASGVRAWDVQVGVETREIFRPVDLGNNRILVLTQGTAYLLDKAAGVVVAHRDLNTIVTTNPVVDLASNTIGVGGLDFFYGLYLDQLGGVKWVSGAPNDSFQATPAVIGNDALLATRAGRLLRVTLPTGQWDWKDRKTNGPVVGGIGTDGGTMFVPCLDSRVYAFGAQGGGELWQTRLEGTLDQMPVPVRDQVLVPASGKGLYSLSTENGDIQWEADGATRIATISGDHVWAQDEAGNLRSISLNDGSTLATAKIPLAQMPVYNTEDNLIFLINKAGVLGGFAPIR